MNVNDQSRMVELWLTKAEVEDPELRERLKPLYQKYRARKYLVAVFLSGEEDLYELTRDLLRRSRKKMAEREVRAARSQAR